MALRWPSVCARVLCIKFNFLKKIGTKDDGLSSRVFRTLAVSDVESIHLVRQCRFLEASNFTSDLITSPATMSITHIKKAIFSKDYSSLLADAAESSTLRHVLIVATSQEGSWPKFWDHALNKGAAGTSSALALLKILALIPYNGICPIKDCKAIIEDDTAAAHFLSLHTDLKVSLEECLNAVVTCSDDFFVLV